MIRSYKTVPKELFRINNGRLVRLRPWTAQRQRCDIFLTETGTVKPKALDPASYKRGNFLAPNGASLRPNSPYQHHLVKMFQGGDALIYAVPKGTALPEDLILVHERSDHWSLQPAKEIAIDELNEKITAFLEEKGEAMSMDQWQSKYPAPTESSNFVRSAPRQRVEGSLAHRRD
ncbi:hypothetical protein MMC24_005122 [Lignoscripta atroalba]|nr:hypothetical protein [Lignoscripta atroalba]